jgi:uncharacterized protein with ParB-like and HNH nuclease domain
MEQDEESKIEDNLEEEVGAEETTPFKYSITSYGADYDIEGIVKRMTNKNIYVPTFQRGYVWTVKQASRFIESLLLGLPVPGIFLSKEQETQKLLVIDGQQRLKSLEYFYSGIFEPSNRKFSLQGVQEKFVGKSYKDLSEEDKRRLDDSILHATIIKQDEPSDDDSSIYYIFERINTGGTQLQAQEIRACIYHGQFNELLSSLNQNPNWRSIYGPVSKNMRDQELILRFLALYFNLDTYKAPMKEFLNLYMAKNKNFALQTESQCEKAFLDTVNVINTAIGKTAFRPQKALNAAVLDAVMVGTCKRISKGKIENIQMFIERYNELLADAKFGEVVERATADTEKVNKRISLATEAFADIE